MKEFVVHHFPAQSITSPPSLLSRTTAVPTAPAVFDAIALAPAPVELVSQGHAA